MKKLVREVAILIAALILGAALATSQARLARETRERPSEPTHNQPYASPGVPPDLERMRYAAATFVAVTLILAGGVVTLTGRTNPPEYATALSLALAWLFVGRREPGRK